MRSKVKIEEVYSMIPVFVTEDAGLPLRYDLLTQEFQRFLEDFFEHTMTESCDFDSVEELLDDLQVVCSDLEGIIREFDK